jgi:hypothetical protein
MIVQKINDNVFQVEISKNKAVVDKAKNEKEAIKLAIRKRF